MAAVGNYEVVVVRKTGSTNGAGWDTHSVSAPSGKKVLSVGYKWVSGDSQVPLRSLYTDGATGYVVILGAGGSTPTVVDVHLVVAEMGC